MRFPVIILAAGKSSRMGGADKLAEPVDGIPLLRLQALRVLALRTQTGSRTGGATGGSGAAAQIIAALPATPGPRDALLDGLGVTRLHVTSADDGMGATLREAVASLPPCDRFMVLLGDLATLETADLRAVGDASEAHPGALIWRGATSTGKPGHPIIFDATLRPLFAGLTGDDGGQSLVAPLRDRTYLVPLLGDRARRDLDTPQDWAAFRAETGR